MSSVTCRPDESCDSLDSVIGDTSNQVSFYARVGVSLTAGVTRCHKQVSSEQSKCHLMSYTQCHTVDVSPDATRNKCHQVSYRTSVI